MRSKTRERLVRLSWDVSLLKQEVAILDSKVSLFGGVGSFGKAPIDEAFFDGLDSDE